MHLAVRCLAGFLLVPSLAHAQSTTRVSINSAGFQSSDNSENASVSRDGRFVAFESLGSNLVAGDGNGQYDVFVRDQLLGQTQRASVSSAGTEGNQPSLQATVSDDGQRVAFRSLATNLVANDTNFAYDVFVHEFATGQTTRVSVAPGGAQLAQASRNPVISADGAFVAYATDANTLVAGDANAASDVYVVELATGVVRCASVSSAGVIGNGASDVPAISADGRYVAFESLATNLVAGDTNAVRDVFVHDFATGTTVRASVDSAGGQASLESVTPRLSADGRFVVFSSASVTLVAGDLNGVRDVFVHDLATGLTELASVDSSALQANGASYRPSISADGRYVAFDSEATNLAPSDTNGDLDVFVHDRVGGSTQRASVSSGGQQGSLGSLQASIAGDGRVVVFQSHAPNLVTPDVNGSPDIFARFVPSAVETFCFGDGPQATSCPCANYGFPGNGCENSGGTGGANLGGSGATLPDSLVLNVNGELSTSLSIFLQGDAELNPGTWFGDGVRCVGGALKRLYAKNAVNGSVSAPGAGELGIRARSAQLGDTIPIGATRSYQVYYRDPDASFCTPPFGNTWNVTNGVRVHW